MVNPTIVQMKGHSLRKKLSEIVPKLIEGQEKLEEGYNLMYSLEEKVSAIDEEVQTRQTEEGAVGDVGDGLEPDGDSEISGKRR